MRVSGFLFLVAAPLLLLLRYIIYLRKREKESAHAQGGAEGKGDSHADSVLSSELDAGLSPRTLRLRPEPKPRVGHLSD